MAFPWAVFQLLIVILVSSQCQGYNQTLSQQIGTFASPRFPLEYENDVLTSWTIMANPNHAITLSFRHFRLESCGVCSCDYVKVYDGRESGDLLLGRYCGTTLPNTTRSTGNTMYVVFRTDGSVTFDGFSATYQSQECAKGRYGPNCAQACNEGCFEHECDRVTGNCLDGCKDGYTGDKCNECVDGKYGSDCSLTCTSKCYPRQCQRNTGHCTGCVDGYYGNLCENTCLKGTYGPGCGLTCSPNCEGGECNSVNGHCTRGCTDVYVGDMCDIVCDSGTYGTGCLSNCSQTCKDGDCHPRTGHCYDCTDGYTGDMCEDRCRAGIYGPSCSKTCSVHCFINATDFMPCHHETGACPQGCIKGYTGQRCESEISEDSIDTLAMGIGIGVGSMVLVGIIIAVVAVCCYRRRSSPAARIQEPQEYDQAKMDGEEEHSYKEMYKSDDTQNLPIDAPSEAVYQNTNGEIYQSTTQSANADDNVYEEVTEMRSMEGREGGGGNADVIRTSAMSTERSVSGVYVNVGMTE